MNNGKITSTSAGGEQYDGSKTGTELDRWHAQLPDPQSFIKENYTTLSSRCATLYNTNPFAIAAIDKPLSYIVGEGIYYQCLPNASFLGLDPVAAAEWGAHFSELVHYDKVDLNYYEKQRLLLSEGSITGDGGLWYERDEEGYIQDLIATGGHIIDAKRDDESKNITLGIQTDTKNRRTGLYVVGQDDVVPFQNENGTQNVTQVFLKRVRAGQIRGYSVLQALIALLKNGDTIWDATLQRMIHEAVLFAKTKSDNVDIQRQLKSLQSRTVNNKHQKEVQKTTTSVGPSVTQTTMPVGSILNFDQNGDMEFNKLETPSSNFQASQEWLIRLVAMGRGYAPEFLRGEYPTSYSAGQGAINDSMQVVKNERKHFTDTNESVLHYNLAVDYMRSGELPKIPGFFEPTRRGKRVRHALLDGKFFGPVPGYRNPLSEAKADVLLHEKGLRLRSDLMWKGSGVTNFSAFLQRRDNEEKEYNNLSSVQQERLVLEGK